MNVAQRFNAGRGTRIQRNRFEQQRHRLIPLATTRFNDCEVMLHLRGIRADGKQFKQFGFGRLRLSAAQLLGGGVQTAHAGSIAHCACSGSCADMRADT